MAQEEQQKGAPPDGDASALRAERMRWRRLVDLLASLLVLAIFAGLTVGVIMYFRAVMHPDLRAESSRPARPPVTRAKRAGSEGAKRLGPLTRDEQGAPLPSGEKGPAAAEAGAATVAARQQPVEKKEAVPSHAEAKETLPMASAGAAAAVAGALSNEKRSSPAVIEAAPSPAAGSSLEAPASAGKEDASGPATQGGQSPRRAPASPTPPQPAYGYPGAAPRWPAAPYAPYYPGYPPYPGR